MNATGMSLVVFNSVVLDPPGSPELLYSLHTPPQAIGELVAAAGAGQLLLSHRGIAAVVAHGGRGEVDAGDAACARRAVARCCYGVRTGRRS